MSSTTTKVPATKKSISSAAAPAKKAPFAPKPAIKRKIEEEEEKPEAEAEAEEEEEVDGEAAEADGEDPEGEGDEAEEEEKAPAKAGGKKAKFNAKTAKKKWNYESLTVEEFENKKILDSLTMVIGGKTRYYAQIDKDGALVQAIRFFFEDRLIPLGAKYFPPNDDIANENFVLNHSITKEEVRFFTKSFIPWNHAQILKKPTDYFGAKWVVQYQDANPEANEKALKQNMGDFILPEHYSKKGKFCEASIKSKIRVDFNPKTKKGTRYPTINIFEHLDHEVEDSKAKCLYFYIPSLTKAQLEAENVEELKAKYKKAVAAMKEKHPIRTKIVDLIPRMCRGDIETDFLGISTMNANAYISTSVREIKILQYDPEAGNYVKREIGEEPTARRTKRAKTAKEPAAETEAAAAPAGGAEDYAEDEAEITPTVDPEAVNDEEGEDNDGAPAEEED